jgi:leucyl aminopeptidase
VIQSYSGASIEIIDTDAEGRLVADGLSYLIKITSQNILRYSYTNGSSVGTLGYEAGALFTNNKPFRRNCKKRRFHWERLWQLPLWDVYKQV